MKLTSLFNLQFLMLCLGLWCAFPALSQELEDESCEDLVHVDNCSHDERCCEHTAPIKALILTIARCTVDPEPDDGTCENIPMALPKSVLSCVFKLEAAKDPHTPYRFFEASRSDHQPIPNSNTITTPDDRIWGTTTFDLEPPSYFIEIALPRTSLETRTILGYRTIPETPG